MHVRHFLVFIIVLSGILCQALVCQTNEQIVNQFTMEDGLPSMTVYDIVQDSKGYIWAATESGVSRFDGYNFTTLTAENGLTYNEVVSMVVDSRDRIWLNSSGPVSYIENDSVYFLEQYPFPNLAWNFQVIEDQENDLWILNRQTVQILDGESLEPLKIEDAEVARMKDAVYIGQHEDISFFYDAGHIYEIRSKRIIEKIPFPTIYDSEGLYKLKFVLDWPHLYCAKEDGLSVFDLRTRESKIILPDLPVVKELKLQGRRLLASGTPDGLSVFKLNNKNEIEKTDLIFSKNNICGLFLDDKEYLWAPSYRAGIFLLKPESDIVLNYLPNSILNSISLESSYKDPLGNIWIGSQDAKLFKLSENGVKEFNISFGNKYGVNRILDIDFLEADKLLLTMDVGVVLFDKGNMYQLSNVATKQLSIVRDTMLISAYNCTTVAPVASYKSDKVLDSREIGSIPGVDLIFSNRSYSSLLSQDGTRWVSDEKEGLVKINKRDTVYYSSVSPIFKTTISKLVPYKDSIVLAATKGEGLIFITPTDYYVLDRKLGLSNNSINDLHIENDDILISTNNGLNIVTVNNLDKEDFIVKVVDSSYGLKSAEIRSANIYNDKLLLLTNKGLIAIESKSLENELKPKNTPFYINQVKVNGNDQVLLDRYELQSDENNLILEYAGISFSEPGKLLYAYKMEGVDEDWIYTRSRETHYSKLEPGFYSFHVALVTDKSALLQNSKTIEFTIEPHYTDSLWFRALMFMAGFFLLFISLYFYNLHREKGVLSKMVDEKTSELDMRIEELAEANSQLEKSNQDLQSFAHVTSHDLKSPLRNVTSFIQLLERKNIDNFDKKDLEYLNFSKEGVARMERTINDLLLYSSLDKAQVSKELNIYNLLEEIKLDLDYFTVDKGAEIILEGDFPVLILHHSKVKQLFQNLIENGLKYNRRETPKVLIHCEQQEYSYLFSVKDNGIGIEKEYHDNIFGLFKRLHSDKEYSGTGIGLAICKRIVQSYGGKIWLESVQGYGSTFYFTIPKHLSKY